jgi:hypothetical protein
MTIFWRVALISFICIPKPVRQKTMFSYRKSLPLHFVLFQVFNFWFFGINFILWQTMDANPNFFFGFECGKNFGIRILNTGNCFKVLTEISAVFSTYIYNTGTDTVLDLATV